MLQNYCGNLLSFEDVIKTGKLAEFTGILIIGDTFRDYSKFQRN
jgi:hypothetical protein